MRVEKDGKKELTSRLRAIIGTKTYKKKE